MCMSSPVKTCRILTIHFLWFSVKTSRWFYRNSTFCIFSNNWLPSILTSLLSLLKHVVLSGILSFFWQEKKLPGCENELPVRQQCGHRYLSALIVQLVFYSSSLIIRWVTLSTSKMQHHQQKPPMGYVLNTELSPGIEPWVRCSLWPSRPGGDGCVSKEFQ